MGIRNPTTREALLRIDDLTLVKAINFCRTSEHSKHQSLRFEEQQLEVNYTERKKKNVNQSRQGKNIKYQGKRENKEEKRETFKCRRCQTVHSARECPAFGK
nr:unnamed protein product [Callosobruchus analis]